MFCLFHTCIIILSYIQTQMLVVLISVLFFSGIVLQRLNGSQTYHHKATKRKQMYWLPNISTVLMSLYPFSCFLTFLCDSLQLRELTTSAASFARAWLERAKEAARQGGMQTILFVVVPLCVLFKSYTWSSHSLHFFVLRR